MKVSQVSHRSHRSHFCSYRTFTSKISLQKAKKIQSTERKARGIITFDIFFANLKASKCLKFSKFSHNMAKMDRQLLLLSQYQELYSPFANCFLKIYKRLFIHLTMLFLTLSIKKFISPYMISPIFLKFQKIQLDLLPKGLNHWQKQRLFSKFWS